MCIRDSFNELLTREVLGRLQINEVDGKNVFTLDEYLGIIFDEMFSKKTGSLQLANMAFQNSFVENLTGYIEKGEFSHGGSRSLREAHNETTCSCHAYCESHRNFDAVNPLSDIVSVSYTHLFALRFGRSGNDCHERAGEQDGRSVDYRIPDI